MVHRLTVVLDDDELYRMLKVRAALEGAPLKQLIESALRAYVLDTPVANERPFDYSFFDAWREKMRGLETELGPGPRDASDVKRELYGYPPAERGAPARQLAEERAEYDAHE